MFRTLALLVFSSLLATHSSFAAKPNALTSAEKADGFKLMFDGKALEGFRNFKKEGVDSRWVAEKGALTLTGRGGGNLVTEKRYKDFEFRFEFRISAGGNSGILWHSLETRKAPHTTGPEYQILDSFSKTAYQTEIAKGNVSGALYDLIPTKPGLSRPAGEWNTGVIRVQGSRIRLEVNGTITADVDTTTEEWKAILAKSKFAKQPLFNSAPEGYIVFQDHGNQVSFRTLRIREL
ncbi:MAG: DUF1080 domain-containing protein [Verrucomicrobiaceae bacterium]|nr:MAG: DUF1080 domain-containing protein [Verrucomicrobiaceae bacterium]